MYKVQETLGIRRQGTMDLRFYQNAGGGAQITKLSLTILDASIKELPKEVYRVFLWL